ncbi:MAG: hypothetical protein L6R37_004857 [Teloschistes peruensis]|nr:MAG: hypothetical protein L6R37_004857 [Teloschistes peruensis]
MPFSDIFADLLSSLSLTEAHAEAPPAEDKSEEQEEESGEREDKSEGGEEGDKDEGGDDEGGDDAGGDEGEDEAEEEEEEEEEEEVEDIKPKLEAECAKSSQCAPLKHHFDACAERVQKQQEDEDHKGPKEDCVEECRSCPSTLNFKASGLFSKMTIDMGYGTVTDPRTYKLSSHRPRNLAGEQWLLFSIILVMHDIHSLNRQQSPSAEEQQRLLGQGTEWEEMADRSSSAADTKDPVIENTQTRDTTASEQSSGSDAVRDARDSSGGDQAPTVYRVYKRRWFGLLQLVLMNIIVSWDWLSFSPVANTAATHFRTHPTAINWLSTSFLFAFVLASPATILALHRGGPRLALITSSLLILTGNWIRYAGTRASPPNLPCTMFGQILIGLAQPFVLSAPTHYSSLWFSPRGRVSATALASLANPFGGALGQLINPFLAAKPTDIPPMTLYIALISSFATIPSLFIPARPPTPPSFSSTHPPPPLKQTLHLLATNKNYLLLTTAFAIYVGLFNALSSLLTSILTPHAYTETQSGIAGALLILVGLATAAITSPLVDRSKKYLLFIRTLVPVIAAAYVAFIFAPGTHNVVAPYTICALLGAASFALVPVALEWGVEVTWPAGPEAGSTVLWAGGQLLGGVFIVACDALRGPGREGEGGGGGKGEGGGTGEGEGEGRGGDMGKGLVLMAVLAVGAVPCVGFLGRVGGRLEVDKGGGAGEGGGVRESESEEG